MEQFRKWNIESDNVAYRKCDNGFISYRGFAIPKDIRWFFGADTLEYPNRINVILVYDEKQYAADITVEKNKDYIRMFFRDKYFISAISKYSDSNNYPTCCFKKIGENIYNINFIEKSSEINNEENEQKDILKQYISKYFDFKKNSEDYNEQYKFDFAEEHKDTFDNLDDIEIFKEKFKVFLSDCVKVNIASYSITRQGKMYIEILDKYSQEFINILKELFNEENDLQERIDNSLTKIKDLRDKSGWHYNIGVQTIAFFLFVKNYKKYPLFSKVTEYKNFFEFINFQPFLEVKNKDTGYRYKVIFDYINNTLISIMDEVGNKPNNALDAQDFIWCFDMLVEDEQWYPSLNEYNPNISVDTWIELLKDKTIFDESSLIVMKRIKDCDGIASCKELSEKYGKEVIFYNNVSGNLAKRIHEKTKCNLIYSDKTNKPIWYFVLYLGKYDENNIYYWKLRDELNEALDQIDLSNIPLYEGENKEINYWFLNANPQYWSPTNIQIGEEHSYSLYSENGYKRKIFKNFEDAKTNDIIIIYASTPIQKIVSIAYVTRKDDDFLYFSKIEDVKNSIEYKTLKEYKELEKMEVFKNPQGSLFKLTQEEYNFIMNLIKNKKGDNNMTEQPLNQILYGPPGTGKTYNTVIKAMEIIDKNKIKYDTTNNVINYDEVKKFFEEYKSKGQIEFITFHQSYSYEEFVEGIKPNIEEWEEESDELTYKGTNGVLKNISNNALYDLLDIDIKIEEQEIDFNKILNLFMKKYPEGSELKTTTGKNFEIIKYLFPKSLKICPKNSSKQGDGYVVITFKYLQEMYNKNKEKEITTVAELTNRMDGHLLGFNSYYFPILQEIIHISNENKNEIANMKNTIDKNEFIKKYYDDKILLKANSDPKNNYVLIIDEINRGNISKIFGELITLIEEDKRIGNPHELKLTLPYSQEEFGIPKNLYIIGTMNTSDRSIASVDIALRRRFKFIEMMPKNDLVADIDINGTKFQKIFEALNEKITILLDRDHQIGHSYFMKNKINEDIEKLKNVWFDEILPLLNEYFYNDWEKLQALLGEATSDNNSFIVKRDLSKYKMKNIEKEDKCIFEFIKRDDVNFESALLKILEEETK